VLIIYVSTIKNKICVYYIISETYKIAHFMLLILKYRSNYCDTLFSFLKNVVGWMRLLVLESILLFTWQHSLHLLQVNMSFDWTYNYNKWEITYKDFANTCQIIHFLVMSILRFTASLNPMKDSADRKNWRKWGSERVKVRKKCDLTKLWPD